MSNAPTVSQFQFYRSLHNDRIYPAMKHPVGYEDAHPTEWQGVTVEEGRRAMQLDRERSAAAVARRAQREKGILEGELVAPPSAIPAPPSPFPEPVVLGSAIPAPPQE